ncbi:hypothetical protein Cni_G08916 [Canna indica]|uniref:C2 NT-type domain-containing protein n=1 Tax=Canna indica TaxID=4628 RepID=A0AAQ3K3Q2_9LILI|nr:hypothetical protein Cni_G08916 [Canna indica]
MFKTTRWRSEKNKIKVVFKFQFQATQVPLLGSETVMVSLVPQDVGRPTVRSELAAVVDGTCSWLNPIYETVKLVRDPKSGKMIEKLYQFLVSVAGSSKHGVLGEAAVNLADYVEVFKAFTVSLHLKAGSMLHVSIFFLIEENGLKQRTLQSQLSKYDNEKGLKALIGRNDMSLLKGGSQINREPRVKFPSSRNLPSYSDSNGKLHKSHSSGAISASSSGSSSEINLPKENNIKNGSASIQSSTPAGSTNGSTNFSSGESGLQKRFNLSDEDLTKLRNEVVFLTRKVELSELELQNLRKQIVKESRQAQDLSREISSLKEERDALLRECEQLKPSQKKTNFDGNVSTDSILEEIKQELDHERNLNSSLRLQLQKTQEANSELLLAVRDLDDLLEEKNREFFCRKCIEERELYKKDREELVMQMEQLVFDYEILKQVNHEMSYKLEQAQLHEQVRIQHECSEHLEIINDLESHVEFLEAKLQTQAGSFESDVDNIMQAKVEQEKKAIQMEETLKKTKWNVANNCDRLYEEIRRLSSQASSVFYVNEKIVKKVLNEASELRSENIHLRELLQKTEENLVAAKGQYRMNLQQLFGLYVSKSNEANKLLLELKDKNEELEIYKKYEMMVENLKKTDGGYEMMLHDRNCESELLKKETVLLKQVVETSSKEMNCLSNMRNGKEDVITMEDKHCLKSSKCDQFQSVLNQIQLFPMIVVRKR